MVVLKGAIKTHSYVRFDHLRYARRDGGVLVALAAARRRGAAAAVKMPVLYTKPKNPLGNPSNVVFGISAQDQERLC